MLTVSTSSHPGAVRPANEDAVLWDASVGLLAVADGMGGHNAGEVASRLALETLQAHVRATAEAKSIAWTFGYDRGLSLAANRLLTAAREANHEVFRTSQERRECAGMGTTLTAALIESARLTYLSVGDSRLYERRGGVLHQLTRDDSWIEQLADASDIDRARARGHPMRHLLTSAIGTRGEVAPAVGEVTLTAGHLLLICTDGLHGEVSEEAIDAVLAAARSPTEAVDRLVRAALEHGGKDNITALVAQYEP